MHIPRLGWRSAISGVALTNRVLLVIEVFFLACSIHDPWALGFLVGCIGFSHSPALFVVHIIIVFVDIPVLGAFVVPRARVDSWAAQMTFVFVGGWPGHLFFSLRARLLLSLRSLGPRGQQEIPEHRKIAGVSHGSGGTEPALSAGTPYL